MGKTKKRKKEECPEPLHTDSSDAESVIEVERDKFQIYRVPGYTRKYEENTQKSEYIVFLTHQEEHKIWRDVDRLALSKGLRKYCVSGVMHLKTINKYKVGITFDLSNNANVFLQNSDLLNELDLHASIPAKDTEVTGVLTSVPTELSNKKLFSLIGSSRNVIQVRRFMRRVRSVDGNISFEPTQTVAVTFSSTKLPEFVYLDNWRHEVKQYIPPVKQCLKCLRFGHIAKFCRNAEVCSICTGNHNYKTCTEEIIKAKCTNCGGNHIAVSSSCPLKKQKIEENKIKSRAIQYVDLFNEKTFPSLNIKSIQSQLNNLMKSDTFMNLIVDTITKLISNKNKDIPINSSSIKDTLQQTLSTSISNLSK